MNAKRQKPEYTDAEIKSRARDMIERSFSIPYKPHKELVGTTKRAKKMAERKKSKDPKSR